MKIAINALSARFGGGLSYIKNLLENLSKIDFSNDYIIFMNPESREKVKLESQNFKIIIPKFPSKAVIRRTLWEQIILPFLLKRYHVDVLFSPGCISPLFMPKECSLVAMAQNMAPFSPELLELYPSSLRKFRFYILRTIYPIFVKRADMFIAISWENLEKIPFQPEEYRIIYHGRNELFKSVDRKLARKFLFLHYEIDNKFILYVSNIARYKKQVEVIKAYKMALDNGDIDSTDLLLAGINVEPDYYQEVTNTIHELGLEKHVRYLGQVPQMDLPFFYSAASLFVFASICENCPNILIEALGFDMPILSSDRPPMPEICSRTAYYFDPDDPRDLAYAIRQGLRNKNLRYRLHLMSQDNSRQFSWEITAAETLRAFEDVYDNLVNS